MMSSMPVSTLSTVETASADLWEPVRRQLRAWCDEPALHARFLNTLSFLEHLGSRKIMNSQMRGPLGCEVLKHLSEEARHAYFFKRQAERVAGTAMRYDHAHMLAPAAALMYFGRLDAGISRAVGTDCHIEVPYLYVSMIIELRAIWAYRLYHDVLQEAGTGLSLRSLLAEEELHLPQMYERLDALGEDAPARQEAFVVLEDRLFRRLWNAFIVDAQHAEKALAVA